MALTDLLSNLFQTPSTGGGGNDVDGITVTGARPQPAGPDLNLQTPPPASADLQSMPGPVSQGAPQTAQSPDLNYNNSQAAGAVNSALTGEPPTRGGMANPGIYGVLPQSLQHGTLRNMLGALGDAFLVGSGRQAQYEPRMQRQEIGKAMAGYNPDDPASAQAAIQRIAATGAAGSPEIADQLQKNYNDVQLRKQLMQQNSMYKQQTIQARNDSLYNRMNPVAQADLAQAKDADDYKARLARWNTRIKAIDPSQDAVTAFGVPEEFAPGGVGATAGMTNQQITQSADRAAQRAQAGRDTDVNARSRIQAAGIGAGSRNYNTDETDARPTSANMLQDIRAKVNAGETLQPGDQAIWNHATQLAKKGRALPPGLTTPGGGKPVPTAADHAYAKAHPEARAAFQAHFGVAP